MEIAHNSENVINEQILEIRFAPNPKILDYRGTFSEQIQALMGLVHWKIDTNRIDVYDDNETRRFFLSFRNFGTVIRNTDTRNYFSDQSIKFARFLIDKKEFGSPIIDRVGVRSRFCIRYDSSYETLLEQFSSKLITFTPQFLTAIDGKIIDFNFPFIIKTSSGVINANIGPINNEQFKEQFPFSNIEIGQGIFIDVDYWDKPKDIQKNNLIPKIKKYGDSNWEFAQNIINLIA